MLLILLIALRTAIILSTLLTLNPATLRIWLIISAATLSVSMGISSISWFGLILFLIYIGGILVIFSYFVVIQPNQHLEIKTLIITTILTIFILSRFFINQPKTLYSIFTLKSAPPFLLILPNSLIILLILAIVLFLALVAAVKITKLHEGPLRPFAR